MAPGSPLGARIARCRCGSVQLGGPSLSIAVMTVSLLPLHGPLMVRVLLQGAVAERCNSGMLLRDSISPPIMVMNGVSMPFPGRLMGSISLQEAMIGSSTSGKRKLESSFLFIVVMLPACGISWKRWPGPLMAHALSLATRIGQHMSGQLSLTLLT